MARPGPNPQLVHKALLGWYRPARRGMPWRRTTDPYAIWVSEVMLQQTQVATVKPYYERFLKAFPMVKGLAQAGLPGVLKVWEGLGYYGRARRLHAGAKLVCHQYGGHLPRTVAGLLTVPGIGPYSAGAIASIAFGLAVPAVDGNVARVLCRLFGADLNVRGAAGRHELGRLVQPMLDLGRPGAVNQALMDLGWSVCTPATPHCGDCPLARHCRARQTGRQGRLPRRIHRPRPPHFDVVAGVIWRRGRILIDQRPAEGLLGGLWEFPGGKVQSGEAHEEALAREVREELGIQIAVGRLLDTIRHAYSHFRITMRVFECRYVRGRTRAIGCAAFRWVRPAEMGPFAFPRANQRIIQRLLNP
jgi:A/G-specific adenine glycosylase